VGGLGFFLCLVWGFFAASPPPFLNTHSAVNGQTIRDYKLQYQISEVLYLKRLIENTKLIAVKLWDSELTNITTKFRLDHLHHD